MARELAVLSPHQLENAFSGRWLSETDGKLCWRENK